MQGADNRKSATTGTVGKALALLDIIADAEQPPRFTEILQVAGQPRGTLHRQLTHLVDEGLLSVNRDHTYSLGLRLLRLASHSWSKNQFRAIAEPHLKRLHQLTTETVHLGVLNGTEVIYLDKVESQRAVRMYSQIGNASPAYCTGVGKAAMSTLGDEELKDLVSRTDFHRFIRKTRSPARVSCSPKLKRSAGAGSPSTGRSMKSASTVSPRRSPHREGPSPPPYRSPGRPTVSACRSSRAGPTRCAKRRRPSRQISEFASAHGPEVQ